MHYLSLPWVAEKITHLVQELHHSGLANKMAEDDDVRRKGLGEEGSSSNTAMKVCKHHIAGGRHYLRHIFPVC